MARFQPRRDLTVEAILRASRPEPDPAWVRGLERSLLPSRPRPLSPPRLRISRFGLMLAGGLAAVATTLSLAGVGPLARGADSVDAHDRCRVVSVTQLERVPFVVAGRNGEPTLIAPERTVTRRVLRCPPSARPRGAAAPAHARRAGGHSRR